MHDLHLQAENYTEAGFTLKLYANMLSWDRESLIFAPSDSGGQPEWQRKERLYHEVILLKSPQQSEEIFTNHFFSHFRF